MSTKKNILSPLKTGFIGLLFVVSNYAFATSYYVDATNGNDSNSGTSESTAWKTVSKVTSASSGFIAGDVIAFKKGQTFHGSMRYQGPSGTSDNPITFTSYGTGAKPILTINGTLTGTWIHDTSHGIDLWRMPISGALVKRLWRNGVEQYRTSSRTLGWNEIGGSQGAVFRWDEGTNTLFFYNASNPTSSPTGVFTGAVAGSVMTFSSVSHITISGLKFVGGQSMETNNCSYFNISHNDMGWDAHSGIYMPNSSNWTIEYNTFDTNWELYYSGYDSYAGCDGRGVNDCLLSYSGASYHKIGFNTFKNWGHGAISFEGGSATRTGNKIYHNLFTAPDISYGRAFAISGNGTTNNEIYRNHIYDMPVASQIGGKNNHIHHNWFEENKDSPMKHSNQGQAITISAYDGNPTGNVFEYNTIKDTDGPGFHFIGTGQSGDDVSGNTLRKNLFSNNGRTFYTSWELNKGIAVEHYVDIRSNNFIDNAFANGSTVYHRQAQVSPEEFNNKDGVQGDNISGNTATVADQGAGNINEHNIGSGSTQTVPPTEESSIPAAAPETGAFIMDRSGLH